MLDLVPYLEGIFVMFIDFLILEMEVACRSVAGVPSWSILWWSLQVNAV